MSKGNPAPISTSAIAPGNNNIKFFHFEFFFSFDLVTGIVSSSSVAGRSVFPSSSPFPQVLRSGAGGVPQLLFPAKFSPSGGSASPCYIRVRQVQDVAPFTTPTTNRPNVVRPSGAQQQLTATGTATTAIPLPFGVPIVDPTADDTVD